MVKAVPMAQLLLCKW